MGKRTLRKTEQRADRLLAARAKYIRLVSHGMGNREASEIAGVSSTTGGYWRYGRTARDPVTGLVRRTDPVAIPPMNARYLSEAERVVIAEARLAGRSLRSIAIELGRAPSTVSREIRRNTPLRGVYRPFFAEKRARSRLPRIRVSKLESQPALRIFVRERLLLKWSPWQISAALRRDFPDEPGMRLSHEAIYRGIYRGAVEPSRSVVEASLRRGRAARLPRSRVKVGGAHSIARASIHDRHDEALSREVVGHWEGDLVMGALNRTAVATLVERSSRFIALRRVEGSERSLWMRDDLAEYFNSLPKTVRRSLAWDRVSELNLHVAITRATAMPIYFCDPYSPWQRGSNENANGLLRQYLPRRTDLSLYSQVELDAIAAAVNARPRRVLGWRTPAEVFADALTAAPSSRQSKVV